MTAGPCVSLPKIESVSEKPSSAAHLGGQRRSLTREMGLIRSCLTMGRTMFA